MEKINEIIDKLKEVRDNPIKLQSEGAFYNSMMSEHELLESLEAAITERKDEIKNELRTLNELDA